MNIKNAKDIVQSVLETDEISRNSDDYLFIKVCAIINAEYPELTLREALRHREQYGIPSFETVRRTRQKLQAEEPKLRPCDKVKEARAELEHDYFEFAIGRK